MIIIASAILILAFYWLMRETNWLRIRLPVGGLKPILLLKAGVPVLQLPSPQYEYYAIEYITTTAQLRQLLRELSKVELEVSESES